MKNKAIRKTLRLFTIISIIFTVVSIILNFTNTSYADSTGSAITDIAFISGSIGLFSGIPMIFIYIIKLIVIAIGGALQGIMSLAYSSFEGTANWVGIENIIFAGVENKKTKIKRKPIPRYQFLKYKYWYRCR